MTSGKRKETAATIILAIVCVGLIVRLLVRVSSVDAVTTDAAARIVPRRPARLTGLKLASAQPDPIPTLNLDLYSRLQSQPAPEPNRDPFAFLPTPQEIQAAQAKVEAARQGPAPPPPPPFKAVGFSQSEIGQLRAYLTDGQNVYAVHMGDEVDKRYLVVSVTQAAVVLRDELDNHTAELPFPQ